MKKVTLVGMVILATFALTACSAKKGTETNSSSKQTSSSVKKSTSTSKSSSQKTNNSENQSSEKSSSSGLALVNEDQVLKGDYSSLNGTWVNVKGYQLVFNNGEIKAPTGANQENQNYTLIKPKKAQNLLFLDFSPAPKPNGMSIMIALKGTSAQNSSNSDGTKQSKDRIIMGNNGGSDLFASEDKGGIPDSAYYKVK